MVRHVILWQLKDELSAEEKLTVKKEIKVGLENLQGKIPGLLKISVHITGLASSNADLMLDSAFEDEAALKGYAVHPLHQEAKTHFFHLLDSRVAADYEV